MSHNNTFESTIETAWYRIISFLDFTHANPFSTEDVINAKSDMADAEDTISDIESVIKELFPA